MLQQGNIKLICIKNRDETGGIPWSKNDMYHKLKVGDVYEGKFLTDSGGKYVYIKEFDYKFCTPWWFMEISEWRDYQLIQLGLV